MELRFTLTFTKQKYCSSITLLVQLHLFLERTGLIPYTHLVVINNQMDKKPCALYVAGRRGGSLRENPVTDSKYSADVLLYISIDFSGMMLKTSSKSLTDFEYIYIFFRRPTLDIELITRFVNNK